jgi:NTE family protein
MSRSPIKKTHHGANRPPFECVALLLQGGGALGAYQGGVYQALAEADLHPDWVAGISIGAINAAIIAGNTPSTRVGKLRAFWESITDNPLNGWGRLAADHLARGEDARSFLNQISSGAAMLAGVPGFYAPRLPPAWLHPLGSMEATSYYETKLLRETLERFADFDRINASETRLSVGAVNVRSGNFVYFDSTTYHIKPEHVMASGALPPAFPAVEVDGEYYWDGGLISNTPLHWVVQNEPRMDTLAFQVDLWSARGDFPRDLSEVAMRQKEIQYSSRTRANTDSFKRQQKMRCSLARLLEQLPDELNKSEEAKYLQSMADHKVFNIVHLIYRTKHYEGQSKDYEFSRLSMEEHWQAGYLDAVRTLRHPEVLLRPDNREGVFTFDLAQDGRE